MIFNTQWDVILLDIFLKQKMVVFFDYSFTNWCSEARSRDKKKILWYEDPFIITNKIFIELQIFRVSQLILAIYIY